MLIILSDGSSLSASALAEAAGMSPQTASSHLAKLLESFSSWAGSSCSASWVSSRWPEALVASQRKPLQAITPRNDE
ncbi:winged helix-turn-helix transcriptional regulator [Pseudomonas protegens]|uniref:winged helix-turn-helix transcriptional regulator n=1 Tax=Pseudomonas protegens TaxID=380021 RepID=UPI001F43359A|nr:winged helix-turn-helix transcriptional regulator [Pseudomonas protegens]MCU1767216.1 winged helix-turn-helix transcriptional regulator [Pseudomonas protegens]MDS9878625.1 winged helix-turn-helix transcriptional regulator [Pseudomonas protegens]URN90896.1 MAG: winged helix-turn-helix transcriptional regulator [Pseudomonas protegens]WEK22989.1 MAG: winged helix-turn-helix transcriptional regulator [Pseudomonas protegens]